MRDLTPQQSKDSRILCPHPDELTRILLQYRRLLRAVSGHVRAKQGPAHVALVVARAIYMLEQANQLPRKDEIPEGL